MLGHVSFGVTDLRRAVRFYTATLAEIGVVEVWSDSEAFGHGLRGGEDLFAIKKRRSARPPGPGFHLAFEAPSRDAVDRFYAAALTHGGKDDGAPGMRPQFGEGYYAAFMIDPDGYAIEVVHHTR